MNAVQKSYLDSYFTKIKTSTNESQKKEQFIVLLTLLFPEKSNQIQEFARGSENFVKYYTEVKGESKKGFIDSFYGNLIIEFENDLSKTGKHAEDQLREYVSKIWSNEKEKSDYLCIATDCDEWIIYTPRLKKESLNSNVLKPIDIELIKNEPFKAKISDSENFYLWLDRVFFRENSIFPSGAIICAEFGVNSPHFVKSLEGLTDIFSRAQGMKEVDVAFKNWKKYLKYTYGDIEASEKLFLTHTYLSVFTKVLMAEVLARKSKQSFELGNLPEALTGKFFYNYNIRNYVEKDFFYWVNYSQFSSILIKIWTSTFHLLKSYDFSKIDNDFLKDIYQGLIDPDDRHELGEHYTPDWLCEKILGEALKECPNKIPTVADITCGSGSFLRVSIHLIRNNFYSKSNPTQKEKNKFVNEITKNIIGFEIHPLACFIAKTNYMLALEDLLSDLEKPIFIPIYLCDSLLNSGLDQLDMVERGKFSIYLDDKEYIFPFIDSLTDDRFDNIIDFIDSITQNNSKHSEAEIEKLLLQKINPELVNNTDDSELLMNTLIELTKDFQDKVLNHENTIWPFVLKNNFRPIVFTNNFDVIVGNPPWITLSDIGNGLYKKELENLGLKRYQIAPKNGKLRSNLELATIFLTHAVDSYLKDDGVLYFVLPRSLFTVDHHSNFRKQLYTARMNLKEIWDLSPVSPLFRVPSCVVKASHEAKKVKNKIPGRTISGKLSRANLNLSQASVSLTEKSNPFYLVKLNEHTALSTTNINIKVSDKYYKKLFKQGATLIPRSYYFVTAPKDYLTKKIVSIETEKSIQINAKKPYRNISLVGRANVKYLFHTFLAENIIPFASRNPFIIHLPIININNKWSFTNSTEMINRGHSDSANWFKEVEKSFSVLCRTGKTSQETLDYYGKLLSQDPSSKYWVLYCQSGKNLCATVYENNNLFWADSKLYWFCPKSKAEAYYLSGVLNSSSLNEIIKPFQSTGLFGQRDIHKKILDLGIPRFDSKNSIMKSISDLSYKLSKNVSKNLGKFDSKSSGKNRTLVRSHFKKEFKNIDQLVMKLFTN